jgi:DNA-binding NtrC family response regulator
VKGHSDFPTATTHPESVTGSRGEAAVVGIRWVFPTAKITPLTGAGTFGRDADCTTVLPGQDVSRRHAETARAGPLSVLRDLGSRNGTWVNGQRIEERPLGPKDVVRIGEWVGLVEEVHGDRNPSDLQEIAERWFGGPTLARAVDPARRIAATDLPVIVQGETGTGKEGLARAVHTWSQRKGAFVAVNCAAIPAAMAEGELFGYRKGAFTGAERANPGFFRAADGGTLFLDEILELPAAIQAKLLRVLEQREVQPLGEAQPVAVDVRVVCATQEPLARAVTEKRFRADLLARLDGLTVVLPPLRERREDIAPLFLRFIRDDRAGPPFAVDPKLVEALLLYDWPLNVRELVLLHRRLVALHAAEPMLKKSMLPERMAAALPLAATPVRVAPPTTGRSPTSDEIAFDQLVTALRAAHGNVSQAAVGLGITRARAYRLLEARPGFDVGSLRGENNA